MSERITVDPLHCHGKPCIRGLRYPVENVLEWLASGMTTDETLADYENLEREDILAALSYAARLTRIKLWFSGGFHYKQLTLALLIRNALPASFIQ